MVMTGEIQYDASRERVRMDFGPGNYVIHRYDLHCSLKHENGEVKVEQIPEDQKMPSFGIPKGSLIKFLGTQEVSGTDSYKYNIGMQMGGDSMGLSNKLNLDLWVGKDEPHFPIYNIVEAGAGVSGVGNLAITTHQYLYDHALVEDCNFEDSIFDAPQCIPTTTAPTTTTASTTPPEAADILDRVAKAGGSVTGDIGISLSWSVDCDLDLHVITPNKNKIYYQAKQKDGGVLDVDVTSCSPSANCNPAPVENVAFEGPNVNPGDYEVRVNVYSANGKSNIEYSVVVKAGDTMKVFHNTISGGTATVATLHYQPSTGSTITAPR